jgi:prophage regulatory protein
MERLLAPKEVARLLNIGPRTLRRWIAEGTFPEPMRLNSRVIRWKWETFQHWLDSREGSARVHPLPGSIQGGRA